MKLGLRFSCRAALPCAQALWNKHSFADRDNGLRFNDTTYSSDMLLAIGSNGSGQLSLGHAEDTHIPSPCIFANEDYPKTTIPKAVAAGGNHTLVLFADGRLFAAGSNQYGQCAIPKRDSADDGDSFMAFREVPQPPEDAAAQWDHISAGWEFSVLVSTSGRAYVCGRGPRGELGLGEGHITSDRPVHIGGLPDVPVLSISSGMAHTAIVHEGGQVFGWGVGRKGQLGISNKAKAVWEPRKVDVDFATARVACGREFTFLVTGNGEQHVVLGGEKYGIAASAPSQGELSGWKDIGASWGGMNVLLSDGTIKSWGRNDRGQLPPAELGNVEKMAIGSEHGVALARLSGKGSEKLRAVTWGWGEHGNCGRSREEGGDVVGEIFEVEMSRVPGHLQAVGAGCATTWFWAEIKGEDE